MAKTKFSIPASSLKKIIEETFRALGRKVETHKDCEILAENLELRTGKRIGITTLRRVFGLDSAKNMPSKHTLDTLAAFCGFNSWDTFVKNDTVKNEVKALEAIPINKIIDEYIGWGAIQEKALQLSEYTFQALKKKTAIPYEYAIDREYATRYLINFLNSNKMAMAFIAPGMFGKTVMITKAIEKLWLNNTPLFPNDIIWFLDGNQLSGFQTQRFDSLDWILSQTGLGNEPDYRNYFKQNPSERKGKMILVIDAVDIIAGKPDNLENFFKSLASLIATNDDSPWFKVILTMRNQSWQKNVALFKNYPEIQKLWFGVSFGSEIAKYTNIPYLSKDEIESFLKNYSGSVPEEAYYEIKNFMVSDDYYYLVSDPYFLQEFVISFIKNGRAPNTDTELLIEFYKKLISGGALGEYKQEILDIILNSKKELMNNRLVPRKKILGNEVNKDYRKAYDELLAFGILKEVRKFNKFGTVTTFVNMSRNYLLHFLLTKKIVEVHNCYDIEKIAEIEILFEDGGYKLAIIKWVVNFLFFMEDYDKIFQMKDFIKNSKLSKKDKINIISAIGVNIRHNDKALYYLFPKIANDEDWQKMYFEDYITFEKLIKYFPTKFKIFISYSTTPGFLIYGHSLLLIYFLFDMNKKEINGRLKIIDSLIEQHPDVEPIYKAYAYAAKILQRFFVEDRLDENLFESLTALIKKIGFSGQPEYKQLLIYIFYLSLAVFFKKRELIKRLLITVNTSLHNFLAHLEMAEYSIFNLVVAEANLVCKKYDEVKILLDNYSMHFNQELKSDLDAYYYFILSKYNEEIGKKEQSERYLKRAFSESRISGLKMIEVYIKKNI